MRIAISTDGDQVSAHFGRCPHFTIVDIQDGQISQRESVENPGHQPGALPAYLHDRQVECIIAGGMGPTAVDLFNRSGIRQIIGVTGKVEDVLGQFLRGELAGGASTCQPGGGRGYGVEKTVCDH